MAKHSYSYTLEIQEAPLKTLEALPIRLRREIGYRLDLLQRDFSGDVKKLKGHPHQYRLRIGSYRVLFELLGNHLVVYSVGDRKDVYAP